MGRLEEAGRPKFLTGTVRYFARHKSESVKARLIAFVCVALLLGDPFPCLASAQKTPAPQNHFEGCGSIDDSPAHPACLRLSFQGEVSAEQSFLREFGGGLIFRLNPEKAAKGWFIEVIPKDATSVGHQEYVWVVTPPYHFGNQRYLDTSYGTSAREAVEMSPREFNFVLNNEQYKKAAELVELAISSRPLSDQRTQEQVEREGEDAAAALMTFPVAKGRLWILDSRTNDSTGEGDFGTIEWIKFKVELQVPCSFPVVMDAPQISVDASACGGSKGTKVG